MNPKLFRFLLNVYPPYLGTGIVIKHVADDYTRISVQMKSRFYNRNYVGTHFGGSLYAMTDPFYMLMLIQILGPDYIVWDKSASIKFVKPGRGTVVADFHVTEALIEKIKNETAQGEVFLPEINVPIRDGENEVVAMVVKTLYIRRKEQIAKRAGRPAR